MRMITRSALLLAVALLVVGCGSNISPDVTGNWTATDTSTQTGQAQTFTFSMQEGSFNGITSPVTFSGLPFQSPNCFDNTASVAGAITPGTPRTMAIDIFSLPNDSGNHASLSLTIASDNNSATGTYALNGGLNGCGFDQGNVTFARQ